MQPSRFWGVTRAYVSNLVNIKVAPDSKFEVGKIAANWALMLHTCRFPLGREFHHWWRGQSTEGLRNGWRLQMQKTNWSDFGRPCEDRWKMMKIIERRGVVSHNDAIKCSGHLQHWSGRTRIWRTQICSWHSVKNAENVYGILLMFCWQHGIFKSELRWNNIMLNGARPISTTSMQLKRSFCMSEMWPTCKNARFSKGRGQSACLKRNDNNIYYDNHIFHRISPHNRITCGVSWGIEDNVHLEFGKWPVIKHGNGKSPIYSHLTWKIPYIWLFNLENLLYMSISLGKSPTVYMAIYLGKSLT